MNIKTFLIFVGVTLGVLVGVGALLWQFGSGTTKPLTDVAGEMRLRRGDGDVTVVEFSDFQCPACAASQQPLEQILAQYEGKVSFVYRYFPLTSIHKNALVAAYAAEAAHKQNKFFEYGDVLFSKQSEWENLSDPKSNFVQYAHDLGMDEAQFAADMESEETKAAVATDMQYANNHALTGTPTFFVDGTQVELDKLADKLAELTK